MQFAICNEIFQDWSIEATFDKIADNIDRLSVTPYFMNSDNVWMLQLSCGAGLA